MGTIYVVAEHPDRGPVKIGMTETAGSSSGRAGLRTGNWRRLEKIAELEVELSLLRWKEWRIHQSLRPWHKGGEWYAVRPLLADWGNSWDRVLRAAAAGRIQGGGNPNVGRRGHRLLAVERVGIQKPAKFRARCSCGAVIRGGSGQAFITVVKRFCNEHAEVPPPEHLAARASKP